MSAIVVNVNPMANGTGSACWVTAPFNVANRDAVTLLSLDDVFALNGPDVVRQMGELLSQKIRENSAVSAVLDVALARPVNEESLPICFKIGDSRAHSLGWEALFANNVFLGLDSRWPIGRIARGGTLEDRPRRSFASPIRLVCVLSAIQVEETPEEWAAVHGAVVATRAAGLPVNLTVFSGQESLVTEINDLNDPHTTARGVPGPDEAIGLVQAIEELEPHLLHLFCHGSIKNGVRLLEIATATDINRNDGVSSVLLLVEELGIAVARAGTWGVVLNTCRGAQAADDSLTHAEEFVNAGVPFAVGMKRQIDVADALAFSSALYPEIFRTIKDAAAKGPGDQPISWVQTLIRARQKLRDLHGADPALNDSWTVPILYGTPGGFTFVVALPNASETDTQHTIGEATVVDGLVDLLADGAPESFLTDLRGVAPAGPGG